MLKELIFVAAIASATGMLMSQSAVRLASAANCESGCEVDTYWIFQTGGAIGTDCYIYGGETAFVGHVDGDEGMKTPIENGTTSKKKCPRSFCDPMCTPVVDATFHQSSDSGEIDYGNRCEALGTIQTHECEP